MPRKSRKAAYLTRLKLLLKTLGVSQRKLADDLKVAYPRLNSIVNCKAGPSLALAAEIARYLGVAIEDLMGDLPESQAAAQAPTKPSKSSEMTWADL